MMHFPIYINGSGTVSPQPTLEGQGFDLQPAQYQEKYLKITPPDYKKFIDVKLLRRMSKIVKMGIVSARLAMEEAGVTQTDAIITGTGMGCQIDTEKFLNSMLENNETLLTPTSFIQSTHNTIGAQIALMLENKNYNMAYVHRTFSFESTLLDAMMQLSDKEADTILVGGIDEITEESWLIKTQIGYYKKENVDNLNLYDDTQTGALSGEGSAFFVVSATPGAHTQAVIKGVSTMYKPESTEETERFVEKFLNNAQMTPQDIDLVLTGHNGDQFFDQLYDQITKGVLKNVPSGRYKHLCGEYDTASSYALWLAVQLLRNQLVTNTISSNDFCAKPLKNILIYNHFRNINHSLILVSQP